VGPGDDVGADQLAEPRGRLGAGLDGRADAADIAPHQRRHEPAADLDAAGELDIGRLEHRVGGLDHADQALRLDQAEGLAEATVRRDPAASTSLCGRHGVRLRRSWVKWSTSWRW